MKTKQRDKTINFLEKLRTYNANPEACFLSDDTTAELCEFIEAFNKIDRHGSHTSKKIAYLAKMTDEVTLPGMINKILLTDKFRRIYPETANEIEICIERFTKGFKDLPTATRQIKELIEQSTIRSVATHAVTMEDFQGQTDELKRSIGIKLQDSTFQSKLAKGLVLKKFKQVTFEEMTSQVRELKSHTNYQWMY
eukprot:COSAG01_NODE_412_length_17370_cov_26.910196_8_plen_195_part_00